MNIFFGQVSIIVYNIICKYLLYEHSTALFDWGFLELYKKRFRFIVQWLCDFFWLWQNKGGQSVHGSFAPHPEQSPLGSLVDCSRSPHVAWGWNHLWLVGGWKVTRSRDKAAKCGNTGYDKVFKRLYDLQNFHMYCTVFPFVSLFCLFRNLVNLFSCHDK